MADQHLTRDLSNLGMYLHLLYLHPWSRGVQNGHLTSALSAPIEGPTHQKNHRFHMFSHQTQRHLLACAGTNPGTNLVSVSSTCTPRNRYPPGFAASSPPPEIVCCKYSRAISSMKSALSLMKKSYPTADLKFVMCSVSVSFNKFKAPSASRRFRQAIKDCKKAKSGDLPTEIWISLRNSNCSSA